MRSLVIRSATFRLLLMVFSLHADAQPERLRFERININQGLSHNDVFSIMQDSKGYLWFGTADGLNKYDGYRFIPYHSEPYSQASLSQNVVTGIWEDPDGTIWVHPVNSDLNRYNPTTDSFSIIRPSGKNVRLDTRLIQDMVEDRDGFVWASTQFGQLCRFDKRTGQIIGEDYGPVVLDNPYNKSRSDKNMRTIFKDRNGTVWIGNSQGLHQVLLEPAGKGKPSFVRFVHYWYNPEDPEGMFHVWRSFEDCAGKFWLGSQEGLICFDPQTKHIRKYKHDENNKNSLSDNRISMNGIAEDADGNLWVATTNGLNKLNKDRTRFTRYYHDPQDPGSLSGDVIFTILIDRSNTLWIGTLHNGVSKVNLNYNPFPRYRHNPYNLNSLSHNNVTAIFEDREGTIWIGTRGGGLNAWDRHLNKFTHYRHNSANPKSLFNDRVPTIFEDRNGDLWLAGGENNLVVLSRLIRHSGEFEHHFLKPAAISNAYTGPVLSAYVDKQGLFWLGTVNGFLTFNAGKETWTHYPFDPSNPNGVSDPWIVSFCEDKKGNMWLGTSTERLNKLDRKTWKFTHYTHDYKDSTSIGSSTARSIYEDSRGDLWFGTLGGGLCRLNEDGKTFTVFTKKHGLPSNTIHSIQEDDEGNLWLGTGKGLSKFSLDNHTFSNYDDRDGLQSNQFTTGHVTIGASFKGRDGTLYFGGVDGFNAFQPKDLRPNIYVPPVVITQFILFDKALPGKQESKEIVLNHNENFFSFEFAALDYVNSQKNQYAYQLLGLDKDWVASGSRRLASYTNVPPGDYIFRVKGTNSDGLWNEQGTSIKVTILPPWWRTWWFFILSSVAAAFLIYKLLRIYTQVKLEKQRILLEKKQAIEMERMRIASELHDDVGGELSAIRLLSEINVTGTNPQQRLTRISASSNELMQKMNEIVWALNTNNDRLQSLLAYIRRYSVKYLDDIGISCYFEQPDEVPDYAVDGTTRRNIFLLVKEALNNIVKHAHASKVSINISIIEKHVHISVHDNGMGISSENLNANSGNGLFTMRKRARDLNGELKIGNNEGTMLSFIIPLAKFDTKVV